MIQSREHTSRRANCSTRTSDPDTRGAWCALSVCPIGRQEMPSPWLHGDAWGTLVLTSQICHNYVSHAVKVSRGSQIAHTCVYGRGCGSKWWQSKRLVLHGVWVRACVQGAWAYRRRKAQYSGGSSGGKRRLCTHFPLLLCLKANPRVKLFPNNRVGLVSKRYWFPKPETIILFCSRNTSIWTIFLTWVLFVCTCFKIAFLASVWISHNKCGLQRS